MDANASTRIFVRDDDVGALNPQLAAFVDTFADRGLPVSYQIIPAQLTDDCSSFLTARRAGAAQLFEYGQHGLTHEMMVRGKRVFYEFGPERSYDQQLDVIQAGQRILQERLGDHFNRSVFTPPQHKYDRQTLRALHASGVKVLSASSYPDTAHRTAYSLGRALRLSSVGRSGISYHGQLRPDSGLAEISISVPVDNGSRRMAQASDVIAAIESARRHTSIVGLMFHHSAYAGPEDQAFLREVADRLLQLPDVSFHLLGELGQTLEPAGNA